MEDYEYYHLTPDQILRDCLFGFDEEHYKERRHRSRSEKKDGEHEVKRKYTKKEKRDSGEIIDLTNIEEEEDTSQCQRFPESDTAPQKFTRIVSKTSKVSDSNLSEGDFKKRKKK